MTKIVITGFWVCAVTLLASYAGAAWSAGDLNFFNRDQYLEGLEYQKVQSINVPIIADGAVQGYVFAQFVFTADARTLRQMSVPPHAFIVDEAFRAIYSDDRFDFRNLSKQNLADLTSKIKANVNKRLNGDIVKDVLVEEINYVNKSDIRQ